MSDYKLRLRVVTPNGVVFDGGVEHAAFPGTDGPFAVFPKHAPLISSLEKGVISYITGGDKKEVDIAGGFVEVKNDMITALVERNK